MKGIPQNLRRYCVRSDLGSSAIYSTSRMSLFNGIVVVDMIDLVEEQSRDSGTLHLELNAGTLKRHDGSNSYERSRAAREKSSFSSANNPPRQMECVMSPLSMRCRNATLHD